MLIAGCSSADGEGDLSSSPDADEDHATLAKDQKSNSDAGEDQSMNSDTDEDQWSSSDAGEDQSTISSNGEDQSSSSETLEDQGLPSYSDSEQSAVSVSFSPMSSDELVLEVLDDIQIDEIVAEYQVEEGTFVIFSKSGQSHQYFAGFSHGTSIYQFWDMGYAREHLLIEPVEVFGRSLIKMVGICGAACPINLYVYIEERLPQLMLASNWHTDEVDLDQDGNNEIVMSIGTQPDSRIIINENGELLESSSLKDLIHGATSIVYSQEQSAFLVSDDNQEQRYYAYNDRKLVPLKK